MAKTLMNAKTKEVRRVSDEEAAELAKAGWRYIGNPVYSVDIGFPFVYVNSGK